MGRNHQRNTRKKQCDNSGYHAINSYSVLIVRQCYILVFEFYLSIEALGDIKCIGYEIKLKYSEQNTIVGWD